ncbi:MAG: hypothetical protein ACTHN3_13165 [Solirubrobacterales bacterium]
MRYVKGIGLLAMMLSAVTCFTASASATVAESPSGTVYTSTLKAESEGEITLENSSVGFKLQCVKSTFEGKVEQHGSTVTVWGKTSTLTFTECTNGYTATVKLNGAFEVHTEGTTVNGNGTWTWNGAEITVDTPLGFSCTFTTSNTDIGKLTGGTPATLDIAGASIPRTADSPFCGSSAALSGSYKFTTPSSLFVI